MCKVNQASVAHSQRCTHTAVDTNLPSTVLVMSIDTLGHFQIKENHSTVGGDVGCRVGEVRAGTTSPIPDHKTLQPLALSRQQNNPIYVMGKSVRHY